MKRQALACMAAMLLLTGCAQGETYEGFERPALPAGELQLVSDTYRDAPEEFADEGIPDSCTETVSSDDGACVIRKMEHYYDVTIDYEHFTPQETGKAYAEALIKVFPDFQEAAEPYLYENIMMAFPALTDDYEPVKQRITYLAEQIRDEYREELYSFAETLSGGVHGYEEDGVISYEEALTFNLIPEALRGTACSALSLWGDKTETGDMIAARFLDWNLGSQNQMCMLHTVVHAQKGERSYTGISFLGFLSVISAVSDDGVLAAILDGSSAELFTYENRKCYTYELRHALEEYDTAREVGQYMVDHSRDFTFSHNIFVADGKESFCAEDASGALQESGKGFSALRGSDAQLMDSLHWDNPDSLCVVNSFATKGNLDGFSGSANNYVRFMKYNEWLSERERFTIGQIKTALTREKVKQGEKEDEAYVDNVRNTGTVQIILVDYHTGRIQVSFTRAEGPSDDVIFTDIGHF